MARCAISQDHELETLSAGQNMRFPFLSDDRQVHGNDGKVFVQLACSAEDLKQDGTPSSFLASVGATRNLKYMKAHSNT